MILSLLVSAHGACTNTEVEDVLDRTETAFVEMSEAFEGLRPELDASLACLEQPITPSTAARVHRTYALFAFFDSQDSDVAASFARYRDLQPRGELPASLAPADHPLRRLYDDAVPGAATQPLARPSAGWLLVDGEQETEAPGAMPFIFQHIGDDGSPVASTRVASGGPIPSYAVATKAPIDKPSDKPKRRKLPTRSLVGVGIVGVGALTYGGAFLTKGSYKDAVAQGERDRIQRTHGLTNGLSTGGVLLMAAGGGLFISGVL